MALTPEEQAELDALESMEQTQQPQVQAEAQPVAQPTEQPIGQPQAQVVAEQAPAPIGLSPEEEQELSLLESQEPLEGGELESAPLSIEEVKQFKLEGILAASGRTQQQREISARDFLGGTKQIGELGDFELLEAVNQSQRKSLRNPARRRMAVNELKLRGISPDFVETYTKLDDPTGFVQSLKEGAPVGIASMVASGAVGAATKNPKAAAAAAAIAAGIAEAGTEAFNRIYRPERMRDPLELGVDVVKSAAAEGIGDLVGGKVFSKTGDLVRVGVDKLLVGRRAIKGAQGISDELAKLGKSIKPEDIPEFLGQRLPNIEPGLDPAQKSTSKLAAFLIGTTERAFGGGKLLERKEIVNKVALKKLVSQNMDDLMGDIARLSPTQIGALADDAFVGSRNALKNIDNINFSAFKQAVGPDTRVNMSTLKKQATDLVDQIEAGELLPGTDEGMKFIKDLATRADTTNIEQAISNRSTLNQITRGLPQGSNARRLATKMNAELKDQMIKTARGVSPDAEKLGKQAYEVATESAKQYNTRILELVSRDVADGMPHEVTNRIFQPEGLTRIKQAKDLLLSAKGKSPLQLQKHKTAWDELRFGWLRDQVKQATDIDGLPANGAKLQAAISEMGDDVIGEMFTKQEMTNINKSIKAMRLVQNSGTGGSGELARFIQVGAAAGGRFGGKPGLLFAAIGGPAVLTRALTKPQFHRIMVGGKTGQFLALMAKTKRELENEKKKIRRFDVDRPERRRVREFRGQTGRRF